MGWTYMSTNNFTFTNICVVVHDTDVDDPHLFDDDMEYWRSVLADKFPGIIIPTQDQWTRNESYIIAELQFHKPNGEYYASLYATYKSGYYAAACLDYVVEYEYTYDDDESKLKSMERKIESASKKMAKVLSKFGQRVIKVAQFSNGEAVYQAVDKRCWAQVGEDYCKKSVIKGSEYCKKHATEFAPA